MAAQIAAAQSDLTTHIARLRDMPSSGNLLVQALAQQSNLASLQSRIANADAVTLGSIGAEIAATVVAAQSLAQQAQAGGTTVREEQGAVREASEAAHRETENFIRDYYEKREFDPYLRFASKNDEEEYRKRETERRSAIEEALAKRTPEGNLEANRLALEQLKDAGAHGADKSPEYQRRVNELSASAKALGGAIENNSPKGARAAADEFDATKPDKAVSPELIASFRKAGVTVPDQSASGHGVAIKVTGAQQTR